VHGAHSKDENQSVVEPLYHSSKRRFPKRPGCPLDSMLKLAYYTVEHDSHFDEAGTFRRGFAGGAARTAGRVKDEIGFALERVQRGKMPENAKP
jgi:hypothetical protein